MSAVVQRVLVDEPAAGDVDDERGRLHERELLGADHAGRLGRLRHVDRDEVALLEQLVEREQLHAELLRAGARDVGVVGDDAHAERLQARGDERADAAEADDADGLLEELGAGVRADASTAPARATACAAGMWRARLRMWPTVSSAAEMMFEVGALTTMTPAVVAALMSTLSSPTPARATTLSTGAAAIASASIFVAERTSTAFASASAASSAGRSVPSTLRTSKSGPRASIVAGESSSAMSTTGFDTNGSFGAMRAHAAAKCEWMLRHTPSGRLHVPLYWSGRGASVV